MSIQQAPEQHRTLDLLPLMAADCCAPLARQPLEASQAVDLSRAFKALGDPVRLRLMSLIASHDGGEVCVCELTDRFDLTGPTISHHLKVMRQAGLVCGERRGTWVYYRADRDAMRRLSEVLSPTDGGVSPRSG